ncbi:MAG TPA: fused MFS/spermidine synthase [Terracidiphilus sp.]
MTQVRLLFGSAVFLASFLLFMVEPIAAKQLLPVLGGSAAVWITCLVFFQTALLLGYLYAHWLSRRPLWILHFVLLALAAAAAMVWVRSAVVGSSGSTRPILTVFGALSLSIGLPFLMLGATSPLLQVWWARLETGKIPYRLYALSNLASLLALGLYPTVVEPHLTLHAQRLVWTCGFGLFVVLLSVLALRMRSATAGSAQAMVADDPAAPVSSPGRKVMWVLLPMGAAMQLSAVTSYLTANVAAIPLLWILPLGVYLLTLILAFQFPRLIPRVVLGRFLIVMLGSLGYYLSHIDSAWPLSISVSLFLIELFVFCLFLHGEACALRPARASESTLFYLLFAAGGALGSFLIGIAAPLLFSYNYDLSITFFITAVLALLVTWNSGWSQRMLWSVASVMLLVLVFMIRIAYGHNTTVSVRNFYATLRVKQDHSYPGATVRTLTNGTIQHGTQIFGSDQLRKTPTTYYAEDSGVGLALRYCCREKDDSIRARSIGVIGLGAGTVAAYGRPGDRIRFYEINPAVPPIAQNVFTYIRDSGAGVDIVEGDARTSMAAEAPQQFDVLVIDAFSGDAIPLHLLTAEALALYRRHLAPGGILAFHISNRHVNLEPAIALLAGAAGMQAMRVSNLSNDNRGEFSSTWVLVTENPDFFQRPEVARAAHAPTLKPGLKLWTDDYSSLLPLLRW